MKSLLLIIWYGCMINFTYGQYNIDSIEIIENDRNKFVKPTISVLIYFESLTIYEWKKTMEDLRFESQETKSLPLIYIKGSFGNNAKTQSIAKDKKGVLISWMNFKDELVIMDSIENELKPFYADYQGDQKFYLVKKENVTYQFNLKRNTNLGLEEVYIKKVN